MYEKQPSPRDLIQLAEAIEPVLYQAARTILSVYADPDHVIHTKEDRSPVTEADLASHDLIVSALTQLTPQWPVVSEEDLADAPAVDPAGSFWLVDPLDGTKEFIARTGEFSINVGLVMQHRPVFGLLMGPTDGLIYRGGIGLASEVRQGPGGPWQPISCRRRPKDGGVLIASRRSTSVPKDMRFAHRVDLGSALKFGQIAQGRADYYLRRGPTMEWDTCAGHAILEAAGGSISNLEGGPLVYGKPQWRNHGFIAQGRPALTA